MDDLEALIDAAIEAVSNPERFSPVEQIKRREALARRLRSVRTLSVTEAARLADFFDAASLHGDEGGDEWGQK